MQFVLMTRIMKQELQLLRLISTNWYSCIQSLNCNMRWWAKLPCDWNYFRSQFFFHLRCVPFKQRDVTSKQYLVLLQPSATLTEKKTKLHFRYTKRFQFLKGILKTRMLNFAQTFHRMSNDWNDSLLTGNGKGIKAETWWRQHPKAIQ